MHLIQDRKLTLSYPKHMRPIKPKNHKPTPKENLPKAQPGECAFLETITVTRAGAFMDCGLERDLLVPISQQLSPMEEGEFYVVYVYLDPYKQTIGSTKLHNFLDERAKNMAGGDLVDLLIVNETDLGYKAVVNGTHLGLLYKDEVFKELEPGDKTKGFIKLVRDDRKIDLCLQRQNQEARDELTDRILEYLRENGGFSSLTDYSPPHAIYKQFGVSKGNYKKALGKLYKQRLVSVAKDKVTLL
jgi:predicted RNA-binding protein (virulence factor B family)